MTSAEHPDKPVLLDGKETSAEAPTTGGALEEPQPEAKQEPAAV